MTSARHVARWGVAAELDSVSSSLQVAKQPWDREVSGAVFWND